jgi:hypothetical protein
VERTLLSAAVALDFLILNNFKNNSKIKGGKGGGQECPPHIGSK